MSKPNTDDRPKQANREEIIKLLRCLIEGPPSRRYDIIGKIKELDRQSSVRELRALLKHPDPELRFWASEVLLQLDAPSNLEAVLPLLQDPDADVRYNICDWLCTYGDRRAVDALIQVLRHDPDSDVRFLAAVALGNIGDERAIPALEWSVAHDFGRDFQGVTVSLAAQRAIEEIRKAQNTS